MKEPTSDPDGTGMIWLGDLSGFRVEPLDEDRVELTHRCGWSTRPHSADYYLGNLSVAALAHRNEGCLPMTVTPGGLGEKLRQRAEA
jgi:hypothetical protein